MSVNCLRSGGSRAARAAAWGLLLGLAWGRAPAAAPPLTLTIYSTAGPGALGAESIRTLPDGSSLPGYALVQLDRSVSLPSGHSQLPFTDVAALLDPTTVTVRSLTDPSTRVTGQVFQYDLGSRRALLRRYLGQTITLERPGGTSLSGTLLGMDEDLVLREATGALTVVRDASLLRLPAMAGGLATQPTLLWDLQSGRAGEQTLRVSYQTAGLAWWADYQLTYTAATANAGTVDVQAAVTVINASGASYPDAQLRLLAGDVHRASSAGQPRAMIARALEAAAPAGEDAFVARSLDDYHLYTLPRRITLADRSTQQLELFAPVHRVPAQRRYVFAPTPSRGYGSFPVLDRDAYASVAAHVQSYLELRNDRASGLGQALPAGRVRVSLAEAGEGALTLIGEDAIGPTPRDEMLRVQLGSVFDVTGERRQLAFSADPKAHVADEEVQITLHNHRDEAVDVQVREQLFRSATWEFQGTTVPPQRIDARTVAFPLTVPASGSASVKYRIHYSW